MVVVKYLFVLILLILMLYFTIKMVKYGIWYHALKQSGIEKELRAALTKINIDLNLKIKRTKDSAALLREFAFQRLPGLEDRIKRDKRKQYYIRNILPYKAYKGQKRKWYR